MREYQKINSVFKRDERGRFIDGDWACPEFGYLADDPWRWTEKVDGTNVRVHLVPEPNNRYYERPLFGGRTDNAQMPVHLAERLRALFDIPQMLDDDAVKTFMRDDVLPTVTLYGEGYGAKIQRGGQYISDHCDFVLFDVRVGDWWLLPEAVHEVAANLNLSDVPEVGVFSLRDAIEMVRQGDLQSWWPNARIEGLVGTPTVQLFTRKGERVIAKVKLRDFRV